MRILIVDDSKAMRMIVLRTRRKAGVENDEVVEAENGRDALGKVSSLTPDLVLSDWNMPEMTGIELLTELRAQGNPVRFGFVTSETTAEMRERAISGGAMFLLTKPFTADDFAEALSVVK